MKLSLKHIGAVLTITTLVFFGHAQKVNKYAGILKLQDSLIITYKLEFKENDGLILGFSITDQGGEHETKSLIKGSYDKNKKVLSFKEVDLVYTKSPVSLDAYDFCNVHFQPSKFKLGSTKLSGNFKGKFKDGTNCVDGELAMNSIEKINKRVKKFEKFVKKSNKIDDSLKGKLKDIKIVDTLNLNVLRKNQITSIPTTSKSVKLFVYDGGQIDGDVISILKNGKTVLRKYMIKKAKQAIEIPIDTNRVRIKLLAESVGSIGSNTAIIEVLVGDATIKTMTNLKKGETTEIDFIRKPVQ